MRNPGLAEPQAPCSLGEPHPTFRGITSCETSTHFVGQHDPPRCSRGDLLASEHSLAEPAMHGDHRHPQLVARLVGRERTLPWILGALRWALRDTVLAAQGPDSRSGERQALDRAAALLVDAIRVPGGDSET